ncbi:receptor expression-enhancing protein 1-like [Musca domestica]|uniref:Receptor expression-enhancing protein n=2 Tax=Musca domestica TaxID=7370 RepID=A0ABM3VDI3_MUSDO|nr:receptor expression-enhancing protein 1-like [Musca domestica]
MISSIFSRLTILTFGTLYPAYYSFKTVRAKSVDEYMKWMTYWIVFAIFTAAETFTDVFLKWLPFYYELKILLIFWLLPSMGNGSPVVYRKCLHPFLKKHETRIDRTLQEVKHRGQDMVFHYASEAVMFLGRAVMNVVQKNMPHGVLSLLANHGINDNRSTMQPVANSTLVIEEQPIPSTSSGGHKVPSRRKSPGRRAASEAPINEQQHQSSHNNNNTKARNRRARSVKNESDLDINLNES